MQLHDELDHFFTYLSRGGRLLILKSKWLHQIGPDHGHRENQSHQMGKDAGEAQIVAALLSGSLEGVGDSNGKIRAIEITVEMTAEMIGEGDMGMMYIGRSDIWTIDLAEME